jgi:outer membrane immunogenic protein
MKKLLLAIVCPMALGVAAPASAADMPVKAAPPPPVAPIYTWTGLYVGGHAGYSWGRWGGDLTFDPGTGPLAGIFDPSHRTIDANGWLAGGQIGFNYQVNSFVFGLEADASWTNLKGSGSFNTADGFMNWAIQNRLDWFGTVRGRAGFAVNNILLYGTAGVAYGQTSADQVASVIPCCLVTAVSSVNENHIGWTAGAGVEWMYSRNWSVKAEYLYTDLGSADYRFIGRTFVGTPHTTDSFPADLTFHTVRVGVNYKFDWAGPVVGRY